jgi:succinate dehydrogenase/fumarate reductase-like Fe-S protein
MQPKGVPMAWKNIPLFDMLQQQNGKRFNFPREYCHECEEVVNLFQHVAKTGHLAYGKGEQTKIFEMPESSDEEKDLATKVEMLSQQLHDAKSEIHSQELEITGLKQVITKLTQALADKPKNQSSEPVAS